MNSSSLFQRLFSIRRVQPKTIKPGLHHYTRQADGTYTRFHLRVEPDGYGMLIANASLAARLSPSGVLIARGLLTGEPEAEIEKSLRDSFRGVTSLTAQTDIARVKALVETLAEPGDNYPILNLDDAVGPAQFIAPLNADVPLAEPEKLVALIDRLWQVAIPHLTLIVPENPNAAHLVRAVERAEDTGLICGVRARASDLQSGSLLKDVAQAGVDHVNVYFASAEAGIHDALFGQGDHAAAQAVLRQVQELEIAPVAEVPLVASTLPGLVGTLTALNEAGVTNVAVFAIAEVNETADEAVGSDAMPQAAALLEESANAADVRYIWEPPVQRDPSVTLAAQAWRGPRCSGDVSMRVEPDGRVIPPRGPYASAGNLLTDSWEHIWGHAEFRRYRERVQAPTRCAVCPGLAICAVDCPREPAGWSQG